MDELLLFRLYNFPYGTKKLVKKHIICTSPYKNKKKDNYHRNTNSEAVLSRNPFQYKGTVPKKD